MAQARLLHRQQSFRDSEFHGQTFQRLQSGFRNCHQTTALSHQTSDFRQAPTMTQPFLQYQPEGHLQSQQWERYQACPQEFRPTVSAQTPYTSNDTTYPQDRLWRGDPIADNGFAFDKGLHMSPHIVSESEGCSYTGDGDLTYPGPASQGFIDKRTVQYGSYPSWVPSHALGFPYGISLNESDLDTNSAQSPRSYVSDTLNPGFKPFTPVTAADAVADDSWAHYSVPSYSVLKTSSPKHAAHVFDDATNLAFPERSQIGLGISVPSSIPAQVSDVFDGLPSSYDDVSQHSSEYPYSQKSRPGISPWFAKGQPLAAAVMPHGLRDAQLSSTPLNSLPKLYQARNNSSTSRELVAWNGPRLTIPAQERLQDHFQTHRIMDTQAQRKADDEILLKGKKNGETYKEIKKKLHTSCAESTLRGRYRSLTKARQDRVRKPIWREKDIDLLTKFVVQELDRIDSNHHHSLSYEQRLAKVQWKKIANLIRANGGSYHFGNSTCKRKWLELNPSP